MKQHVISATVTSSSEENATPLPPPEMWQISIRALVNNQCFEDAERKALAWLQHEPRNAQAWHMLATTREYRQNHRGAVEAMTQALQLSASEPQWWWYRGYQYLLFGLPSLAEDDFDKALQLISTTGTQDYAEVSRLMRAHARLQLGDYQGALDDCAYVQDEATFWLHQAVSRRDIMAHCAACLSQGHDDWEDTD